MVLAFGNPNHHQLWFRLESRHVIIFNQIVAVAHFFDSCKCHVFYWNFFSQACYLALMASSWLRAEPFFLQPHPIDNGLRRTRWELLHLLMHKFSIDVFTHRAKQFRRKTSQALLSAEVLKRTKFIKAIISAHLVCVIIAKHGLHTSSGPTAEIR